MRSARFRIMPVFAVAVLLFLDPGHAEMRKFTNAKGESIEAEVLDVQEGRVVLRLANGRTYRVPLKDLSETDQAFVKTWHEENKNKVARGDLQLKIFRDNKLVRASGKKKTNAVHTTYECTLDNFSPKEFKGLSVRCIIHERIVRRGGTGPGTSVEEITETIDLGTLKANGKVAFKTTTVVSEYSREASKTKESFRETVMGAVFEVVVDGEVVFTEGHPGNFLKRLEEEAEREEERAK